MLEVRMVPRSFVLFAAALLIAGCAAYKTPDPNVLRANPCASGKPPISKQNPIVCIDDSARKLVAYPDPVIVHDVNESDRTKPVKIQWLTKSGRKDVRVEIEEGCVVNYECDRKGKCWADTKKGSTGSCKYDVWIEGDKNHDRLDPVVVITTCC
ncbi:MAG: hypothetical protein M3P06_17245 [Acidobacteriota bacterium]|nr:hypothetical protein [Acidobacteriota bacterium]